MSEEYVAKLEQINRKLRTSVKKEVADNYDRLIARIDELSVENRKLRECLEFYAEPYNWDNVNYPNMFVGKGDIEEVDLLHIECCGGKIARKCLAEIDELKK